MQRGIYLFPLVRSVFNEKNMWSPGDISKKLQISRSTVHRHLNRLLHEGYIGRYDNGPLTVYCRLLFKQLYPDEYREINDSDFE